MPIRIRKRAGGRYRVTEGSRVRAKGTTKAKANAQARLLRGVAAGWKPTGRQASTATSTRTMSTPRGARTGRRTR